MILIAGMFTEVSDFRRMFIRTLRLTRWRRLLRRDRPFRPPINTKDNEGPDLVIRPFIWVERQVFEAYLVGFTGKFLNMLLMSPSTILVFRSPFDERLSVDRPLHRSFFEVPSNRSIARLPTL